ncbi:MAG TPA: ABC transporter permease [Clostridiales bacterium]|nr:ABC transporter permease [Clostridiales bacterium]HBJ98392.1 ABC transporter permease [Clostridiales bacterium]
MQKFKVEINSKHKLLDLKLKETFRYKDLIFLFVKRDFISRYKQTVLGYLWAIIQPLFTTIIFTLVFGSLANLTTADVKLADTVKLPGFLFYLSGTICWTLFSNTLSVNANVFASNVGIMGKVYYPRLVSPIASTLSQFVNFFIQFVMFLLIWIGCFIWGDYSIKLTPMLLLVPVCIIQLMLLGMGIGLIVTSLTTKYRDLINLVSFGVMLLQYATPVAYGLDLVRNTKPAIFNLYMCNPVTPIITTFRYGFFGYGYFNLGFYGLSWLFTIAFLFLALILFSKTERTFMDTI